MCTGVHLADICIRVRRNGKTRLSPGLSDHLDNRCDADRNSLDHIGTENIPTNNVRTDARPTVVCSGFAQVHTVTLPDPQLIFWRIVFKLNTQFGVSVKLVSVDCNHCIAPKEKERAGLKGSSPRPVNTLQTLVGDNLILHRVCWHPVDCKADSVDNPVDVGFFVHHKDIIPEGLHSGLSVIG